MRFRRGKVTPNRGEVGVKNEDGFEFKIQALCDRIKFCRLDQRIFRGFMIAMHLEHFNDLTPTSVMITCQTDTDRVQLS